MTRDIQTTNASVRIPKKNKNPTQMVRGGREVVSDITSVNYSWKVIGSKGVTGKKKPHRKTSAVSESGEFYSKLAGVAEPDLDASHFS